MASEILVVCHWWVVDQVEASELLQRNSSSTVETVHTASRVGRTTLGPEFHRPTALCVDSVSISVTTLISVTICSLIFFICNFESVHRESNLVLAIFHCGPYYIYLLELESAK